MKRYIDLTRTIVDEQAVYPGDDATSLKRSRNLSIDGFNNHRLQISMHSGTHIDGPMHMSDSPLYIDQMPLEKFVGSGVLLDVRGQNEILLKEEYVDRIAERSIVLFWTGRDEIFGNREYFVENPFITEDFAKLLVEKKVKAVGFDSSSPDRYPYPVHGILFSNGVLIIENLTNLASLQGVVNFEVLTLPLKIHADSSIARVIAAVQENE
ncbi:MAG: cyclase family protein [Thermotogaceae bacterium]|nr:cyclase family protein [Mesotoga sp.]MDI9375379.1 cyclase family protein [Thermotogota bacterium]NLX32838.1 cyclase family protein [Thermotogaceae bacterium]MDD4478913.1 cyclase family protein [Mesotoga sp.]HPI18504.1 cyclase family protein [Mesotoga sp.]